MDYAALQGHRSGLSAVARAELAQYVVDVSFDGGLADIEACGNLFVAIAPDDEGEDVELARRQARAAHSCCQAFGDGGRNAAEAGMHCSNCFEQFFRKHAFQQISAGTGLQGAVDVFVAVVGGQYDDPRGWKLLSNCNDRIDAAHAGHSKVHNRDIGAMLLEEINCLLAVSGFGDHSHIALRVDQGDQPAPYNIMVIDNEQLDFSGAI